jgi:hypothetical protein
MSKIMTNTEHKARLAKEYAEQAQKKIAAKQTLTKDQKRAKLAQIFREGGSAKLAQAMVGPISIRVNYEGIARQALVEDMVPQGTIRAYPVLDELPAAYALNSNDGEVRVSRIEGKQVIPQYGRIAAEYEISRTDIELLAASPIDYAENMTVQQLAKQEDALLYDGLDLAVDAWKELHPGNTDNDVTLSSNTFTLDSFLDAQAHILDQQVNVKNIITSPGAALDMYRWDLTVAGVSFKDDYFAGYKRTTFGDFNVLQAVTVPKDTVYVTAPSDMLGIFSTRYGISSTPDPTAVSNFMIRNIFDELVSVCLLNAMGVVKIKKTA